MAKKQAKQPWVKKRHAVVRNVVSFLLKPYCKLKYGITVEKFQCDPKKNYLILFNHQTGFDQFFVGMGFHRPVYYLASEDIFSKGFVSSIIRYLVAPIPIKKQTTDLKAIMNCLRVVKEGGTIAIAPEGNRTYSGKTLYFAPSIATLAKKLRLPILLYRIEGGYGTQPRWSDKIRKGKMRAYVSREIPPEEYANYTDEELYEIIREGLYIDECCDMGEYKHKKLAEYLERAMYYCPDCKLTTFESKNDVITCKKCNKQIRYLPNKLLKGVNCDFPYRYTTEWYDAQEDYMKGLDLNSLGDGPIYTEESRYSRVIPYQSKTLLHKKVKVELYSNRIVLTAPKGEVYTYSFDEVSAVTVLGKNKLNIYHDGVIYQLKSHARFNALKYVHVYNRYLSMQKGEDYAEFLGL